MSIPDWLDDDPSPDYFYRLGNFIEDVREQGREKAEKVLGYQGPKLYGPLDLMALADEDVEMYFPTGFPAFDRVFRGIPNGRVTVVAAATSHGKTAFAIEMALRVARRQDGYVIYVSAELGPREMAHRIKQRGESLTADDLIVVSNDKAPTTKSMRGVIEHIRDTRDKPPSMLIFDYLDYSGEKVDNKIMRLEQAAAGCHEIAGDFWMPVIIVQQLNREMEKEHRAPYLTDLSWCDFPRKAASMVLMLQQRYVQAVNTSREVEVPEEWDLMVYVRKNTHGRIGDMQFQMDLPTGRIWDNSESAILG